MRLSRAEKIAIYGLVMLEAMVIAIFVLATLAKK